VKPRLLAIYLLIVLAPLGLLTWFGFRLARDEREMVQHKYRELLTRRLQDISTPVTRYLGDRERDLLRLTNIPQPDAESLRELARTTPHVRQFFVLDTAGKVTFPPPLGDLSEAERDFLQRSAQIWRDRQNFLRGGESSQPWGWYTWYWGDGLHVVFWQRLPAGHVVGAEIERARLLADVIALLPEDDPGGRIIARDANDTILYQWGPASATAQPAATVSLHAPLASCKLEFYPRDSALVPPAGASLLFSILAAALALVLLAVYFYREHTRQLREAGQRVSFVNQVSHELKTPLTNIRMYAELLQAEQPSRHLDVIVSESQRLSRLINNVLTFARQQRGKLTLHPQPGRLDEMIQAVVEHFRPTLAAKGVTITVATNLPQPVTFDRDALEQILGNLLSNVEKYAATGGQLAITAGQTDHTVTITVTDRGPGIPARERDNIFQPFHRLSNKLTDGVAGTGIGLTIARDLARQHGGDVKLLTTATGACFEITLKVS